jgi:O-methyltransferase
VSVTVENQYQDGLYPLGTLAPWRDETFQKMYREVKDWTMINEIRLYQLWALSRQGKHGCVLEVGTWRGGSGALLAAATGVRTFLCDTFSGVVKRSALDTHYEGGEHADASRADVEQLLQRLKLDNAHVIEGVFPDETGSQIQDVHFRFCHIDVDVYEGTRDVLRWVWPRLLSGGIVVIDDYGFRATDGATRAVQEHVKRSGSDCRFIYNVSGQAILVKTC